MDFTSSPDSNFTHHLKQSGLAPRIFVSNHFDIFLWVAFLFDSFRSDLSVSLRCQVYVLDARSGSLLLPPLQSLLSLLPRGYWEFHIVEGSSLSLNSSTHSSSTQLDFQLLMKLTITIDWWCCFLVCWAWCLRHFTQLNLHFGWYVYLVLADECPK